MELLLAGLSAGVGGGLSGGDRVQGRAFHRMMVLVAMALHAACLLQLLEPVPSPAEAHAGGK